MLVHPGLAGDIERVDGNPHQEAGRKPHPQRLEQADCGEERGQREGGDKGEAGRAMTSGKSGDQWR
jgi:hypothetical protein